MISISSLNAAPVFQASGLASGMDAQEPWRAYFELGVDYLSVKKYEESLTALVRSLEHNGSYVPTWVNLGFVFMQMGQLAAACIYTKALEILPGCAVAKVDLGVLFFSAADYEKAESYYKSALADDPGYGQCHLYLAQLYEELGRLDDKEAALADFARTEMIEVSGLGTLNAEQLSCTM